MIGTTIPLGTLPSPTIPGSGEVDGYEPCNASPLSHAVIIAITTVAILPLT